MLLNAQRVANAKRRSMRYYFYVDDPKGKERSIHGDPVSKITANNWKDFKRNVAVYQNKRTYESDIKPVNRVLAEQYLGEDVPDLHKCFFDIEVDFDPKKDNDPLMRLCLLQVLVYT